jgi:predicted SAM-dependent methyltransferase
VSSKPIKLHLGCGDDIIPGYVNCDAYNLHADLICDVRKLPFQDNSVQEVISYHLLEHFDFKEAFLVLKEWRRVLISGGLLVVETPNFLTSCEKFINSNYDDQVKMYGHFFSTPWENPGMIHKFLYTPSQLKWTLIETGFVDIRQQVASKHSGDEQINMNFTAKKL